MQTLLNHSIELIAGLYLAYVLYSVYKFYFKGDKTMTDEAMMQAFVELERRKATRARVPKRG